MSGLRSLETQLVFKSPAIHLNKVVLPPPDIPTMATESAEEIAKEMFFKIGLFSRTTDKLETSILIATLMYQY